MTFVKKYEVMILLTEEFKDNELKSWVFNCAKNLRKFSIHDVSVVSRGKQNLSYPINKKAKSNYIQLNFSSVPKYLTNFFNVLKLDSHVLRFLIFKKS
jgi:ribosomal protein S6